MSRDVTIRVSFEYTVPERDIISLASDLDRALSVQDVVDYEKDCFTDQPKDYAYFLTEDPDSVKFEAVKEEKQNLELEET